MRSDHRLTSPLIISTNPPLRRVVGSARRNCCAMTGREAFVGMPRAQSTLTVGQSVPVTPAPDALARFSHLRPGPPARLPLWLTLKSWQGRLFWIVLLIGPIWLLDTPLCNLR